MTESTRTYDIVVLGAGPAGENLAQYATETSDLTAVLIERELVGGECSYYACMPSKALLRPIEVLDAARNLPGLSDTRLVPDELLNRRNEWVSNYDDAGQVEWAEGAGIDVIRGTAQLTGEREVTVRGPEGTTVVSARRTVVLATGSEPTTASMYAECAPWDSRDATGVVEIPDRIIIIGGGVVACEAAVWLAALGSKVTMLVRGDRILDRVEPFASDLVEQALRDSGVDVRTGTTATAATRQDAADTGLGRIHGGPVTVTTEQEELVADEILVAMGRRPRLDDLGLDAVDLQPEEVLGGKAPEWLVAVGDASGEAPLTHWGKYRARILGAQLAASSAGDWSGPDVVPVPQVVFTEPQVASVGLTEKEARDAGHDVVKAMVPWSASAGASLLRDNATGAAQIVVDAKTHLLLGATFVGPEAAELIHAATVAIVGAVPTEVLRHAVPSYPTASELWLRLLEALPEEFRAPIQH